MSKEQVRKKAGLVFAHLQLKLPLAILVALSASIAGAETNQAPDPAHAAKGKHLYLKHCIQCHQKDGVGEPNVPMAIRHPDYVPAMPLNETSHAWHHSDEQLRQRILIGIPDIMPAFGKELTSEQAGYLVAYIKSLWSERIIACQGPKHMTCMSH